MAGVKSDLGKLDARVGRVERQGGAILEEHLRAKVSRQAKNVLSFEFNS